MDGQGDRPSATWPGGATPAPPALPAAPALPQTEGAVLPVDCAATRGPLFRLALKTGALTVVTLGLYRFWMKTRLRRWYWSSVRPGGLPLEYTGAPLEKLLGFLIAVVILAFYIGLVNLGLTFLSLSFLEGRAPAALLSIAGLIPLLFFARYRARRYVLSRTRWRGIRFGVDPGAWGYTRLAMGQWLLTLLSLGLLWPRMTFALEKYRTDRTWFGDRRLLQTGDWTMLVPAFAPLAVTCLFGAGLAALALLDDLRHAWGFAVIAPAMLWALAVYTVGATRRLTEAKRIGPLRLEARPRAARILRIWIFGTLAAVLLWLLPFVPLAAAAGYAETAAGGTLTDRPAVLGLAAAGLYVLAALLWSTLRHVFLTMPVWRHYAETLTVIEAEELAGIGQRGRDGFVEAEGFAEALDVGAAI